MLASLGGHTEGARALLEAGAAADRASEFGWLYSCLHVMQLRMERMEFENLPGSCVHGCAQDEAVDDAADHQSVALTRTHHSCWWSMRLAPLSCQYHQLFSKTLHTCC